MSGSSTQHEGADDSPRIGDQAGSWITARRSFRTIAETAMAGMNGEIPVRDAALRLLAFTLQIGRLCGDGEHADPSLEAAANRCESPADANERDGTPAWPTQRRPGATADGDSRSTTGRYRSSPVAPKDKHQVMTATDCARQAAHRLRAIARILGAIAGGTIRPDRALWTSLARLANAAAIWAVRAVEAAEMEAGA
jgi:hypothetical protein